MLVFKAGNAAHPNNIELGRHGRYRTNLWSYAGINSFGKDRDDELALHPTVKPVALPPTPSLIAQNEVVSFSTPSPAAARRWSRHKKPAYIADNEEDINRAKVMIDARKWTASKLKPKKYGDRISKEISGPDGGPVDMKWTVEIVNPSDDLT